jgi:hypothetical protein
VGDQFILELLNVFLVSGNGKDVLEHLMPFLLFHIIVIKIKAIHRSEMIVSSTCVSPIALLSSSSSAKSNRCRSDFSMLSLNFLAAPASLKRAFMVCLHLLAVSSS